MRKSINGTFDVLIAHPVAGLIPFTASADDVEAHGRELHSLALQVWPWFEMLQQAAPGEAGRVAALPFGEIAALAGVA